ncbi:Hypothetical protein A7982_01234 [Minicystis rosea]|nr:Hypothetical protein A7982_01234 [Minicystis rosea]
MDTQIDPHRARITERISRIRRVHTEASGYPDFEKGSAVPLFEAFLLRVVDPDVEVHGEAPAKEVDTKGSKQNIMKPVRQQAFQLTQ